MKNLAGFKRAFHFSEQKHICTAAKNEARPGCNNIKIKQTLRKDIYETHTNPARNASLSDADGFFSDCVNRGSGLNARLGIEKHSSRLPTGRAPVLYSSPKVTAPIRVRARQPSPSA